MKITKRKKKIRVYKKKFRRRLPKLYVRRPKYKKLKLKKINYFYRLPIFYFTIHRTRHNLFLGSYFRTGRLLTTVTSGSAGYSGKRNISPATARIIAKLFIEKFFMNRVCSKI